MTFTKGGHPGSVIQPKFSCMSICSSSRPHQSPIAQVCSPIRNWIPLVPVASWGDMAQMKDRLTPFQMRPAKIAGTGTSGFIWPFQYVQRKLSVNKGPNTFTVKDAAGYPTTLFLPQQWPGLPPDRLPQCPSAAPNLTLPSR